MNSKDSLITFIDEINKELEDDKIQTMYNFS